MTPSLPARSSSSGILTSYEEVLNLFCGNLIRNYHVGRRWKFVRTSSVTLVMIPGVDSLTPPSILLPRRWNLPWRISRCCMVIFFTSDFCLFFHSFSFSGGKNNHSIQAKIRKNQQEETRRPTLPHLRPYYSGFFQGGGEVPSRLVAKRRTISFHGR